MIKYKQEKDHTFVLVVKTYVIIILKIVMFLHIQNRENIKINVLYMKVVTLKKMDQNKIGV